MEKTKKIPQKVVKNKKSTKANSINKPKNFKLSLGKMFKSMKGYTGLVVLAVFLSVLSTLITIIGPIILNKMMKAIPDPSQEHLLTTYGIILVCLYTASFLFNYFQGYIMSRVSVGISTKFRSQISQKINRLPLSYFDKNSYGDTLSRITNDIDTFAQTLDNSLTSLISSITMIVGIPVAMFTVSWQLTLVSLAEIPVAIILIAIVVKFSQKYFTNQQNQLGEINGKIEEIYSSHNVVKAFNAQDKELKSFDTINNELKKSTRKAEFLSGLMMPIINFVGNLVYVAICVLGAWVAIQKNNFQFIFDIITFMTYIKLFNQPLGQLGSIFGSLQSAVAASERVFDFLEEKEQPIEEGKITNLENIEGSVEFKNVSFSYVPGKEIITNLSFKAKPGQKIAIVGPTGAGKTTIVNLLMRFYDIDKGEILIDGTNTCFMTRECVRSMFAMVLQDTWLYEGTIMENIRYSNKDATDEEIIEACKMANVDHFIHSLPHGYDMVLTEDSSISSGQKQLLTIARAMVQNAPMLILDEATSSVDTRTEILIQNAMDRLMKNKTSFVIAHRLSTIKNADLILVMKDGQVIEQGTHEELLNQDGSFYKDLYNSQFEQ